MADYEVKKAPEFTATTRKLETTDRAHADLFNDLYQKLFDNDNYLKKDSNNKLDADNGDIANTQVSEFEESAEAFPVPVAGDKVKNLWGKMKKWQQDCLAKFGNYVLTSMITNQHLNDTNRIPTSALVYLMQQSITQLNRDLAGIATNLNTLGVVTPESGTGSHNTYYIQGGATFFRKINGVCFLYFDITINSTNTEGEILVSSLPWCTLAVYERIANADTGSAATFYIWGDALKCGVSEAGRYFGYFTYPTI